MSPMLVRKTKLRLDPSARNTAISRRRSLTAIEKTNPISTIESTQVMPSTATTALSRPSICRR